MTSPRFGSLEAGGTKFLCAIGSAPDDLTDVHCIPTTTPEETLGKVISYFAEMLRKHGALDAIGVASFGPADVNPNSRSYGSIAATPKVGWSHTDIIGPIRNAFDVPVGFDTDVNGAILAELAWGVARGLDVATYVTVGTGIGAGTVVDGQAIHGHTHPEASHFFPRRHISDMAFEGTCPFHRDCLEGLACGPAIKKRWGSSLSELPTDHVAHDIEAHYLSHLVISLQAVLSPSKIIFGGGVIQTPGLLDRVRARCTRLGAGYFGDGDAVNEIIAVPKLGVRAGLLGGIKLAEMAWRLRDAT